MIGAVIILGVVCLVVALGAVLAWAVTRREVPGVGPAVDTQSSRGLPDGPVPPEGVGAVRFDQALRGYRMEQVDRVMDRLAGELRERDAEIARLREEPAPAAGERRDRTSEGQR
ncbi:hypothetical protein AVL62_06955 [Serinicoccus chungangensis]|uniref:Cell division protein DivIVA n=1 Tax=Serinicoccus chungangensis TaxID=767452 RepID=A0A0W8IHG8_9MICO|nr:DivIVA domain-containing protein [Serinicoccus chungangensis]KUG59404.1 hypothetical protein AVL62_06955 [Serinicoccus chungangensis]